MRKKLALVDFDKTLISVDSLFYILLKEKWYLRPKVVIAGILLICNKDLKTRSRFKYLLLRFFLRLSDKKKKQYVEFLKTSVNYDVVEKIETGNFDRIVIVSASEMSLIHWVISDILPDADIIANDASRLPNKSSEFVTCWGEEKKNRFIKQYINYTEYSITVFTDSEDDLPIMDIADEVVIVETR